MFFLIFLIQLLHLNLYLHYLSRHSGHHDRLLWDWKHLRYSWVQLQISVELHWPIVGAGVQLESILLVTANNSATMRVLIFRAFSQVVSLLTNHFPELKNMEWLNLIALKLPHKRRLVEVLLLNLHNIEALSEITKQDEILLDRQAFGEDPHWLCWLWLEKLFLQVELEHLNLESQIRGELVWPFIRGDKDSWSRVNSIDASLLIALSHNLKFGAWFLQNEDSSLIYLILCSLWVYDWCSDC